MRTEINCNQCGKSFIPKYRVTYCSKECQKQNRLAVLKELNCYLCKTPFVQKNAKQIYCRQACSIKHRNRVRCEKDKLSRPRQKKCPQCSALFDNSVGKIYCSHDCRKLNKKKYKADILKNCFCCNSSFVTKNNSARFCSYRCRNKNKSRNRRTNSSRIIDKKSCESCGISIKSCLHTHHINTVERSNVRENLMVLCANCHYIYHGAVGHSNKMENQSKEFVIDTINKVKL